MRSTQILSILAARPFLSAAFTPASQRIPKHSGLISSQRLLSSSTTLFAGASMKEYAEKILNGRMSDDGIFYDQARLVYHIDDACVSSLTKYYSDNLNDGDDVLDICSSWVSHYPKDFKGGNVVGLGMNEYELSENKQLTSFDVKDLNNDPTFPYEDNSFDKVTCVVSVDYLNQPKEIFNEISKVLRPGGEAIISISNRCFPTKAFRIWLQTNYLEHIFIVGSFFHYSGLFGPATCEDMSPNPGRSDPLFIVKAAKKSD